MINKVKLKTIHLFSFILISFILLSCSSPSSWFSSLGSKQSKTNSTTTGSTLQKGSKSKSDSFSQNSSLVAEQKKEPNIQKYTPSSLIHVIDANTFRVEISYPTVWDNLLSVLIRNYNIILADPNSGIISTDWDSFYLKENTLRNRISVKVKKLSYNNTELIFHNSVEKLKTTTSYVWLPEPDKYNEIERIMNNMAILLNQPPVKISYLSIGNTKKMIQR